MALLGAPYGDLLLDNNTVEHAKEQAFEMAYELELQGGPPAVETSDKKVIALIAYLQRLGTDISKTPVEETEVAPTEVTPSTEEASDAND